MFDPTNPNPFTMSIMERQQAIDNAVRYFIDLYRDDVDINDAEVQAKVFKHYSLENITESEQAEIARRVERGLA